MLVSQKYFIAIKLIADILSLSKMQYFFSHLGQMVSLK
jgi:hypothetical protein